MMALSNRGGTRTAVERASAWLLVELGVRAAAGTPPVGCRRATIEVARSRTGVSRAALNQGPQMVAANRSTSRNGAAATRARGGIAVVTSKSRYCPLCGAVNGVPAMVPVEPVQTAEPTQPAVAIRYVGRRPWYADQLYGTGLMWHGPGDIQPLADIDKARRMARNHPDAYELVEVESD